jgi:CheY-like chemotaxis protein
MSPIRVLFVDDEDWLLQACARRLRQMKRPEIVAFSTDGQAALERLEQAEQQGWAFDAIVSDLIMPGMDGAALLEFVHDRWPNIVRVLLSGQTCLLDRSNVPQAQMRFGKPAEISAILDAIRFPVLYSRRLSCEQRMEVQGLFDDYLIDQVISLLQLPDAPALLSLDWVPLKLEPACKEIPHRLGALDLCVEDSQKLGLEAIHAVAMCLGVSQLKPGFSKGIPRALDAVAESLDSTPEVRLGRLLPEIMGGWCGTGPIPALYLLSLWGAPGAVLQAAEQSQGLPEALCA